jgi:quercetin dioxygenase-like cupin family protein
MALPRAIQIEAGALRGTVFIFDEAGDILPMHTHAPGLAHITIVTRGAISSRTSEGAEEVWRQDDVFDPALPHEFRALEPGTRIVNIVKGVKT